MANQTILYLWQIQALPDAVFNWRTQFISHGMRGYHHVPRIEAAYAAANNVTLTITAQDGTSPAAVTLPATGNNYHRVEVVLTANKGMLYQYAANSTGQFQLLLEDWIIWVGPWGRGSNYTRYQMTAEG